MARTDGGETEAGGAANIDRSRLDRLLVGDPTIARQHGRIAVVLYVTQAVFTVSLWVLGGYDLPERNLIAFAITLVLTGLVAGVVTGYRRGGLLAGVGVVLAPAAGAIPVAGFMGTDHLLGISILLAGVGIWIAGVCYGLGVVLRRLRARYLAEGTA